MRPIPKKMREEIADDPFMETCCLTGGSPVEWHHNLIFGSRQVNEPWCILPVTKAIHKIADRKDIKELLNWVMLNRTRGSQLVMYSKAINYFKLKDNLNAKYGAPDLTGRTKKYLSHLPVRL